MKTYYRLQYQKNKSSIVHFKYFNNKKSMNIFIKKIPKELVFFNACCETENTITDLTNKYLKEERHIYILK